MLVFLAGGPGFKKHLLLHYCWITCVEIQTGRYDQNIDMLLQPS